MQKQEQRQLIYSVLVHFLSSWIKLHLKVSQDILAIENWNILFKICFIFIFWTWVLSPLICSADSGNSAVPVILPFVFLWPCSSYSSRYTFARVLQRCPQSSAESEACLLTAAGIAPYSKDHSLLQERSKISRTQFLFSRNLQTQGVLLNEPQRVVLCALMQVCEKSRICLGERILPGEVRGATKDMIWVTKWQWGWRQAMLLWCHLVLALSGNGSLVPLPHGLTLFNS